MVGTFFHVCMNLVGHVLCECVLLDILVGNAQKMASNHLLFLAVWHEHSTCTYTHTHTHTPTYLPTYLQSEDFEGTGGLLGSSFKRVKAMGAAGHNRWMCYMILFILFVFLVLYYAIRWRT